MIRMKPANRLALAALAIMSIALTACPDTEGGGGKGSIEFTLSVDGVALPPVFQIQLDDASPQQTGAGCNSSTTGVWNNVDPGPHTVTLSGFPADCTLAGSATQTVDVVGGATENLTFNLSCPPPAAGVFVRFRNETEEAHDVAIGSTDFGTIGPRQDSGCVMLTQGGTLPLRIDGEVKASEFLTVEGCPQSDVYYDAFIAFAGTTVLGSERMDASICQ